MKTIDEQKINELLTDSEQFLSPVQRQHMQPLRLAGRTCQAVLYGINWVAMKTLFRLDVVGAEKIPSDGNFIFTPNHASSLDPFALGAALPLKVVKKTCWAGRKGAVLRNVGRRYVNRVARVVPIQRNMTALAVGAAVLQAGHNLVWFPEGTRSADGDMRKFRRGVGLLLDHFQIPAVPVYLENTNVNMPPGKTYPVRFAQLRVRFGDPVSSAEYLAETGSCEDASEKAAAIAETLQDRVKSMETSVEASG